MEYILIIVLILIYFLPSLISYGIHRNYVSIFILNLFLGWTILGWIFALIWAYNKDKKETIVIEDKKSNTITSELKELKELLNEGILTEEEYESQKQKILKR